MDPDLALLILESELLGESKVDVGRLDQFQEAVIAAATVPEGYSRLAWKGGAKLVNSAQELGRDPDEMFAAFGWRALANGVQAALKNKQLLAALSYASVPFLPPEDSPPVFDHPQIIQAIHASLAVTSRPFIKPSELGVADYAIQMQFGELLSRLPNFSVDTELLLQWSASALRVLPPQSSPYQIAAVNLLRTLCKERRTAAAYYSFRATAEQREDLWDHPIALEVLQSLVERYWQDSQLGTEILTQLCIDDDVLRRLDERSDMLILIGSLAISQVQHYGNKQTETAAWRFVNEMFGSNALVATAFGDYLRDGSLPQVPVCQADQLKRLQEELNEALARVEKELSPRKFKPLANRIYQSNIHEVFTPFLNRIRSGHCSTALLEEIRNTDPEELVTNSELLRSSPDQVGSKVLRKMTSDNVRILQALESAAQRRIELDRAKEEWAAERGDEFELFEEFDLMSEEFGAIAIWALKTLLPELWTRLQEGIVIVKRELEARGHATR